MAFAVDDGSSDATPAVIAACAAKDRRIVLLGHARRRGVGAAIATGYRAALNRGLDIAVVMAGDGQTCPSDFRAVLTPVARGEADYAKGTRLHDKEGWKKAPPERLPAIRMLSFLTGLISGYAALSDSQCGYTAIASAMLRRIEPERLYPGYGYPNDLLCKLGRLGARLSEVPVRALYGIGERSRLKPWKVALPIALILARAAWTRRPHLPVRPGRKEPAAGRPLPRPLPCPTEAPRA
jgi:glycosyltransferase involved in cell wall biosynthesis